MIIKNITLLFVLFFFVTQGVYAQDEQPTLTKEEMKLWKKKKKDMPLEEFKSVMEDYDAVKTQTSTLKRQLNQLRNDNLAKQEKLDNLKKQLAESTQTAEKNNSGSTTSGGGSNLSSDDYTKGKVFRVQVGVFKNQNLAKFVNHPRFHAETDEDGAKKYSIASFRDYCEAECFKKAVRIVGVKDAWIVAYEDNKRVDIASTGSESGGGGGSKKEQKTKKEEKKSEGSSTGSGSTDW
ncbi:MAG: hypothetical protein EAZ57_04825 [Cytophagales bacterium]|nr:MAG: hypothetical protein EAZ67_01055 [Cytophagales bacterium]TAF61117.1 MAG: hypothetical protein EAZ57_04825 [Cytophagales bacterium]